MPKITTAATALYSLTGLVSGALVDPNAESLTEVFQHSQVELAFLALGGAAGAFVRAVHYPESRWRKKLMQGLAGIVSAAFLGGVLGHMIQQTTGAGFFAFAASGFLMGFGGEVAVKWLQDKVFKVTK